MSAGESITSLPEAVAALGALPVPVAPEPQGSDVAAEQLDFLHRVTLPELRREVQHHQDGKARWRKRAETAEARVAELEAERHSTNEALDDAVQQRRADQEAFEAVRALCDAADYAGITSGGWFTVEAIRKALGLAVPGPDAVTAVFSPVASLREPEGEHYALVHHDYRVGHDLPETGGTQ